MAYSREKREYFLLSLWGVLWTVVSDDWVFSLVLCLPALAYLVVERRAPTGSDQSAVTIVDSAEKSAGELPSKLSLAASVVVGTFCAAVTRNYYNEGSVFGAVFVGGVLFFIVIEFVVKLHRSITH